MYLPRPVAIGVLVVLAVVGTFAYLFVSEPGYMVFPFAVRFAFYYLRPAVGRRVLAVVIGILVVAVVALVWLSRRPAPHRPPAFDAAPAIAVALAPLAVFIAVGVAMNGRPAVGPFSAWMLLWGVLAPLAAVYPGLAAFIATRSRAEMAVVGVAVAAPAVVLAIPVLMGPTTVGCAGCQPGLWHAFIVPASLPVLVLLATFLAIEVASAAMHRAGELWVVAGAAMGAVTFGAGGLLSLILWNLVEPPHVSRRLATWLAVAHHRKATISPAGLCAGTGLRRPACRERSSTPG
jgi:hypothetical protein